MKYLKLQQLRRFTCSTFRKKLKTIYPNGKIPISKLTVNKILQLKIASKCDVYCTICQMLSEEIEPFSTKNAPCCGQMSWNKWLKSALKRVEKTIPLVVC